MNKFIWNDYLPEENTEPVSAPTEPDNQDLDLATEIALEFIFSGKRIYDMDKTCLRCLMSDI